MSRDFPFKHFINLNGDQQKPKVTEVKLEEFFKDSKKSKPTQAYLPSIKSQFDNNELQLIHDELHGLLRKNLSAEKYKAYFQGNLKVSEINGTTVTFSVTTSFVKRVIESNYQDFIETAIQDTLGKPYQVQLELLNTSKVLSQSGSSLEDKSPKSIRDISFTLKDLDEPKIEKVHNSNESVLERPIHSFNPDTTKNFDNFVMGPSNNMAYAFALSVAKEPGKVYPSLFIYGNSGLGKTHLLHAIANYVGARNRSQRILILSANTFMREMINAISNNAIHDFRKRFSEGVDILILDDIHELKNKKGTQNEFFNVFNELQNRGKQLIFTSDKHPKEITGIEDRIKTRLSSALSVEIQQPDLETRIAILKKKAAERDLYLDDEVINLIARCIKTNIRELEGSLVKLGAYSSILNVDIDIEIAKEQLKLSEELEQKVVNIDSISRTVASYYKLNLGDIRGKSRVKEITRARHIAMYLAHQMLKTTLQSIGEYFGHRDHTSVMHGIKKIKKDIKDDPQVSQTVYEIESQL